MLLFTDRELVMHTLRTPALAMLLGAALLGPVACQDDNPTTEADTGTDVPIDAGVDADADTLTEEQRALLEVDEVERWDLPELSAPVHVIRTEGNIPHIYAENDVDAARVQGFVTARDRYFMMDLTRRLGLGEVSALLGDAALSMDVETRLNGSRHVAERILAQATPEMRQVMEAYAEGVNAYIAQVEAGNLPAPSELELLGGILGASEPVEAMQPFEAIDIAGLFATFIYESSYETGDMGRAAAYAQLETLFEGDAYAELRRAGALEDIWLNARPVKPLAAGTWGPPNTTPSTGLTLTPRPGQTPRVESGLMTRLTESLDAFQERRGLRSHEKGFGSNAWAVSAEASATGTSLFAADGHLSLGIPSILYHVGLDTTVFGGTERPHQFGLAIPGMPVVPVGTNGQVAWSFTQLSGDITDWYSEQIRLDENGLPAETFFDGEWRATTRVEEAYEIADVPTLESEGRTETIARYQTFDDRWIIDIEGIPADPDDELEAGTSLVRTHSGWVIPADVNEDGVIDAISFAYVGLQIGDIIGTFDRMARAGDIEDFRQATRGMIATSLNFVVSDAQGSVLFSGHQAVPCRDYLPRSEDGVWGEGAHPAMLLDGTTYGNFQIPLVDGVIDSSHQDDPYRCVIPLDESPALANPPQGFVATANNDPVGVSLDGNLFNGQRYIGGPWDVGFRADRISRELTRYIEENSADIDAMAALQANTQSALGEHFSPAMIAAIDTMEALRALDPTELEAWESRALASYEPIRDKALDVQARLEAWGQRGFWARSGVETFYNSPTADDRIDAVATTLFNVWFGDFQRAVFDDEGLPGLWQSGGTGGRIRLLSSMLEGRGEDNPAGLASYNEESGESIFFDVRESAELERSEEILIAALADALDFLASEPTSAGQGGFGNEDFDTYLWGLRHHAKFESLLADFLRDQPAFAALADRFSITTRNLPLAEDLDRNDPRRGIQWFPRDGDQYNVDAANPGISGRSFTYGSGPVNRLVVSLGGDRVEGRTIVPGGQSGLIDSEHFDDQAALWLGDQALPLRFEPDAVAAGATGREVFEP
ncbi:penicillin acylase family protein [Lujinxingia vulgaris]|uniref:Penicillin acylase family protein n=2 Tax=Lujinxingia vulgaris TaxID=2600176 RepID=A0A5C6X1J2_9DELT|nr:penicillin acylase family protein [Lujinxingia vulgaris]